jgi:hypothetical protein
LQIGTVAPDMISVEAQAATVELTPTVNSNDGTPTLETPEPAPDTSITWGLKISAIQDFEDPAGFVNFLMDHALSQLEFTWTPITAGAPTYSGTVQIVPIAIGGDVAVQTVTDVELPLVGQPVRDDAAAGGLSRSRKGAKVEA